MYTQLSKYSEANNLNVISSMMLGAAYDKMLTTVNGKPDGATTPKVFNVKDKSLKRASGSTSTLTGEQAVDKVYNIYDLEGGRFCWTTAFTSKGYLSRGGCYIQGYSASFCNIAGPNATYATVRF